MAWCSGDLSGRIQACADGNRQTCCLTTCVDADLRLIMFCALVAQVRRQWRLAEQRGCDRAQVRQVID